MARHQILNFIECSCSNFISGYISLRADFFNDNIEHEYLFLAGFGRDLLDGMASPLSALGGCV